jgi:hypothetical protein
MFDVKVHTIPNCNIIVKIILLIKMPVALLGQAAGDVLLCKARLKTSNTAFLSF